MSFNSIYIHILKQSKIADYIMQCFEKACNYFNFLKDTDIDTYEWICGNTTNFSIIIKNNYQNINLILLYNNDIIIEQIYEITDLSIDLSSNIAQNIRKFFDNILIFDFNKLQISKIQIEKLKAILT